MNWGFIIRWSAPVRLNNLTEAVMLQHGVGLAEGELVALLQSMHGLARDQCAVQLYRQTSPVVVVVAHPCDRRPYRPAEPFVSLAEYQRCPLERPR